MKTAQEKAEELASAQKARAERAIVLAEAEKILADAGDDEEEKKRCEKEFQEAKSRLHSIDKISKKIIREKKEE